MHRDERIDMPSLWASGVPVRAGAWFLGVYQPSPETIPYWQGVERGELLIKQCLRCGVFLHPRRLICPNCSNGDLEWAKASGAGEVYSFSEVHHPPQKYFAQSVPYVVGIVRLAEGVHIFTRFLEGRRESIAIGAPVEVSFKVLELGHLLPIFVTTRGDG